MKDLFAYGTLMCQDIMAEVSGLDIPSEPAILRGFRRQKVRGQDYPAIQPFAGNHVRGVVYRNIDEAAWARLDRYEGQMYRRGTVQITLPDGSTVAAEAYVLRPDFAGCLEDADWDFEEFLRHAKKQTHSIHLG